MPENNANVKNNLIIKPNKLSYLSFIVFALFLILLGIDMATTPYSSAISKGMMITVCGFLLFPVIFSLFISDAGNLVLNKEGFTIYRLFRKPFFIGWNEVKEFRGGCDYQGISYLTLEESTNRKIPTDLSGFRFPIKNKSLAELMNNWKKHSETGEPLKDYSSYPKASLLGSFGFLSSVGLIFFCVLIASEIDHLMHNFQAYNSQAFTLENQSDVAIPNIEMKGINKNTRSVQSVQNIDFLPPGKSKQIKLNGTRDGSIFIQYGPSGHRQCKSFKNSCVWSDRDKFSFKKDGTIALYAEFDRNCDSQYIQENHCKPDK